MRASCYDTIYATWQIRMKDTADVPDFVILTPGRSGSQFLVSLLDSHPDIRCAGEVVGSKPIAPNDPHHELRRVIDITQSLRSERNKSLFGFKLPVWCIAQPSRLLVDLFERGTCCVVLYRTNKLDMHLSLQLAKANGSWSSAERYSIQTVELDPNRIIDELSAMEETDTRMLKMTRGFRRIIVTYESVVGDPTIPWVQDFLGVELQRLRATTVRSRLSSQRQTISNYDEIHALLANTEFRHYLETDT